MLAGPLCGPARAFVTVLFEEFFEEAFGLLLF
jgi:hypothetical protein